MYDAAAEAMNIAQGRFPFNAFVLTTYRYSVQIYTYNIDTPKYGLAFYRKAMHDRIFADASTKRGVASGAGAYLGFARHECAHLAAQVHRSSCTLFSARAVHAQRPRQ